MASRYNSKHIQISTPSPGVLLLALNRAKVNALNDALWHEIADHCRVASDDSEVRVVVLASAIDNIWTAGLDLSFVLLLLSIS
jgi:delta(3,5)-delta(2,4)-dienoyl-CoA isomerase